MSTRLNIHHLLRASAIEHLLASNTKYAVLPFNGLQKSPRKMQHQPGAEPGYIRGGGGSITPAPCRSAPGTNNLLQGMQILVFQKGSPAAPFPVGRVAGVPFCSAVQREVSDGNGDREKGKGTLAMELAALVEESTAVKEKKLRTRMEFKRFLEMRIKKRVKEQYKDGKFFYLMEKVIAHPNTLEDAYDIIRLSSNVELTAGGEILQFESIAEELYDGSFGFDANTCTFATRGRDKKVLVFPSVKLKVVQEAIRIALEVVYKPHFSKISHSGRSGRDHLSALRYVRKEMCGSNWWFTLHLDQKLDLRILERLISEMQDKIEDPSLYAVIRKMFESRVLNVEFGGFPKGHGLPQEGVLSPIFINVYLDIFDREIFRMALKYEALDASVGSGDGGITSSKLRGWFRRQMNGSITQEHDKRKSSGVTLRCCRFLDEILVAIEGSEDVALSRKSDIENFLRNSLHVHTTDPIGVVPCEGSNGVRFLGTLINRSLKESPAVKAVHKLKDKVMMFGKKWLAHGLKKVKESEIKQLADSSSILSQISCYRKPEMETDHWYKQLLKIWMQNINAKNEENEDILLSKHVVEPSLPQELIESYYKFQKQARNYVSSETAATLALLPGISTENPPSITEITAPVHTIKKRLHRYGVTNALGFPRTCHSLVMHDDDHIIDWFSGLATRWLLWHRECDNLNNVKAIISTQIRMSCIRTLAAKCRIHEDAIEKKFDSQLSRIPSTDDDFSNADPSIGVVSYSGSCSLSLARMVSKVRPCNCFVTGCIAPVPCVYTLHAMERQRFPGWKTGFSSCIHPSLHGRRIGLCKKHLSELFLGHISLKSIDFGSWTSKVN